MPVDKGNNKSKDDFGSVNPTNSEREESCENCTALFKLRHHRSRTILSMTKPDEHKGAIPVVHTEALSSCFTLEITCLVGFYNKTCM